MTTIEFSKDDEFSSIPLNINDIILICKEYSKLGWQIQNQMENILELGVDEAIKTKVVKQESLPHIKNFLQQIINNPYFGEAIDQCLECIELINLFQEKNYQAKLAQLN